MKKNIKKIIFIVILIAISFINIAYAEGDAMDIYDGTGEIGGAGTIAGIVRYFGMACCIGMIMIKGVRFIISSPEGKANIKKEIIPWTIGLVILILGHTIITKIKDIAYDLN